MLALLPSSFRSELKRIQSWVQIKSGRFETQEAEFELLAEIVGEGDWVIDLGANIGHYACRLSELVGDGRVIAFEPVPATFAILSANARHFRHQNVTLINAAASNSSESVRMMTPDLDTGLPNYYQSQITDDGDFSVMALPIDGLGLPHIIALIKIDVDGIEMDILKGSIKKL